MNFADIVASLGADGTPAGSFRWSGALPASHERALELVRLLARDVPPSPLAAVWAAAFADFVSAETDAERHAARENIRAVHAATFRAPPSIGASLLLGTMG